MSSLINLKNGWADKLKAHPFYLFFILFFLFLFIFQLITHIPFIAYPLTWVTTQTTWYVLNIFGLPVSMEGIIISTPRGIHMEVIYECTGIYGIIVYLSAVLATPKALWTKKLMGCWIGILVIWLMNIVRLVTIYWVTYEYPPAFDFIHTYFWQLFLVIIVILVYAVWYKKNVPQITKKK